MRTLSALIDPADIPVGGHVRTPSGNLLGLDQYLAQPERPLSIRERQEAIRERVLAARRAVEEAQAQAELEGSRVEAARKEEKDKKVSDRLSAISSALADALYCRIERCAAASAVESVTMVFFEAAQLLRLTCLHIRVTYTNTLPDTATKQALLSHLPRSLASCRSLQFISLRVISRTSQL